MSAVKCTMKTNNNKLEWMVLVVLLVIVSQLDTCQARAIIGDNVSNYLMQYGYLPQSDLETGNLRSEDQLKDALRNLQSFANLPVTGDMDYATRRLLATPRCGLPDVATSTFRSKRYTLHGQKWHTTNLTWSLRTSGRLDKNRVLHELHNALQVWQDNSKLNFSRVDSDNADIVIHFFRGYHDDGYPFDGRGSILAHAFFPGTGRGGDAHFDEDELWLLHGDNGEGTSLFNVAAHEFGHSLGLSHSSVNGALMFPWYQGSAPAHQFVLPSDDRVGIQQLYGSRTRLWEPIPDYPRHPVKTTTTTTTRRPPYRPPTPRPTGHPRPTRPTERTTTTTRRPPPITEKPNVEPGVPDTCDTEYDAISVIRRETFIFKGKYFWRIGDKGLYEGYPVPINRFWTGLPSNFTHVDAVYERNSDKKIVFFIGRDYWVYNANVLETGYPKPITDLGLPRQLTKVDGAMVWGHNGKTYFFSGTMYWRFDEDTKHVELDYPRDMSMWSGVDYNIDAVFQWKDGITYFFKGKSYWKFNDQKMRVSFETPLLSAPFWMGCPTKLEEPKVAETAERDRLAASSSSLTTASALCGSYYLLVLFLHWFYTQTHGIFSPPD